MDSVHVSWDEKRDHAGADRAYQKAFADYGLDMMALPPAECARRILASAIPTHIVTALDYWAYVKERLPEGKCERLCAIALLADDNSWRQQLRDPRLAKDREALERIAAEESILAQPPANLLILSYLLDRAKRGRLPFSSAASARAAILRTSGLTTSWHCTSIRTLRLLRKASVSFAWP